VLDGRCRSGRRARLGFASACALVPPVRWSLDLPYLQSGHAERIGEAMTADPARSGVTVWLRGHRWVVLIVAALFLMGAECEDGGGQAPQGTCQPRADLPHKSTTAERQGANLIVGKGWFTCTGGVPESVTLLVKLEVSKAGSWVVAAGPTRNTFRQPQEGRKYGNDQANPPPALPCQHGIFRTGAQISGANDVGERQESAWTFSGPVADPCQPKK